MRGVIVQAQLQGRPFVRLYLLSYDGIADLHEATAEHEYVFAYSLADLGDVDGFVRQQKWTQIVPLDAPRDQVFARLNRRTRNRVRRTDRDENIAVVVDDSAKDESYAFYRAIKQADGVTPDIEADFDSVLWINAYDDGELICSTSWFDSGEVLRSKHIVSTRKRAGADVSLIGRLTRRLFWEACLLGLNSGYRYIDLGGLDLHDTTKQGVTEFKQSFGGETVEIYVYRYATVGWQDSARRAIEQGAMVV